MIKHPCELYHVKGVLSAYGAWPIHSPSVVRVAIVHRNVKMASFTTNMQATWPVTKFLLLKPRLYICIQVQGSRALTGSHPDPFHMRWLKFQVLRATYKLVRNGLGFCHELKCYTQKQPCHLFKNSFLLNIFHT